MVAITFADCGVTMGALLPPWEEDPPQTKNDGFPCERKETTASANTFATTTLAVLLFPKAWCQRTGLSFFLPKRGVDELPPAVLEPPLARLAVYEQFGKDPDQRLLPQLVQIALHPLLLLLLRGRCARAPLDWYIKQFLGVHFADNVACGDRGISSFKSLREMAPG